jgi:hypothetical protein
MTGVALISARIRPPWCAEHDKLGIISTELDVDHVVVPDRE